ncbi:hypothetical protein BCR33DRAFT_748405 [Rhizoclosmatium globosum]|uniref:Uncharacterized protein n=1 Tax=Rhizoclosmatium globosum TaxID=329046 RepID=A0A1Y2ALV1_9FUNG|nr:hypothetical protein BCR33DRAFT_748405 [Rhizoclosmatium globosum]|eukprot:ORY23462.1 hypothetical protein BCR33DRAFT_748405 [Rhizoclosmatium globosum]
MVKTPPWAEIAPNPLVMSAPIPTIFIDQEKEGDNNISTYTYQNKNSLNTTTSCPQNKTAREDDDIENKPKKIMVGEKSNNKHNNPSNKRKAEEWNPETNYGNNMSEEQKQIKKANQGSNEHTRNIESNDSDDDSGSESEIEIPLRSNRHPAGSEQAIRAALDKRRIRALKKKEKEERNTATEKEQEHNIPFDNTDLTNTISINTNIGITPAKDDTELTNPPINNTCVGNIPTEFDFYGNGSNFLNKTKTETELRIATYNCLHLNTAKSVLIAKLHFKKPSAKSPMPDIYGTTQQKDFTQGRHIGPVQKTTLVK